ncbi:antibiotic biosynthesis monooxygenase [Streptomyces sp. NPDC002851]
MTDDPAFPHIARPDAPLPVIGSTYAGSSRQQRRLVDGEFDAIARGPWADGLAAVTWFRSMDGTSVLSCAQWASTAAHDVYLRAHGFTAPLAGPTGYRLHSSLAHDNETRVTGCLVTAAFDVDGPERQHHFVEAVTAAQQDDSGHPGAISAHFLLSHDGTRVLLYTEWTSAEAHTEAGEAGDHDKGHEIFSSTPGVRFTHGNRYDVYRALSRP